MGQLQANLSDEKLDMLFHATETQAGTLSSALGREDCCKNGHVVADRVRPAAALGQRGKAAGYQVF